MFKPKLNKRLYVQRESFISQVKITQSITDITETILADDRVVRLFRAKKSGIYAVNTKELMDELEDLMQTRKYRQFDTNEFLKNAQKRSLEWQHETSAYRSRAVHIKMSVFKIRRSLEEQIKNTKGYILNTYSVEIGKKHTSITARNSYIDHLLEPLHKILYRLESVILLADILIGDLDQGFRAIYNSNEILKMNYGKT